MSREHREYNSVGLTWQTEARISWTGPTSKANQVAKPLALTKCSLLGGTESRYCLLALMGSPRRR